MKRDYLNGTTYEIEQPEEMYHFNSDTELLGRFMVVRKEDHVLDIGCNTGALLLYAASKGCASLTGVDLFEEVLKKAKENLAYNGVDASLHCEKIQMFTSEKKYSVIVCNPPYFKTEDPLLISKNPYKAAARHESNLPLDDLFCSAERLLSQEGTFYLVHRPQRLSEIILTAEKYELYVHRIRIVYDQPYGKAKTVLLSFTRNVLRETEIETPAYMNERETFGGSV